MGNFGSTTSGGRRRHRPQPQMSGGTHVFAASPPPHASQYPNGPDSNPPQYHQYLSLYPNGSNPNPPQFFQYPGFHPPPPVPGPYPQSFHGTGVYMGPTPANWVHGQFPFGAPPPPPQGAPFVEHQKTVTIKNDVNIKKDSLRVEPDEENPGRFVVAFTFDAAAPGSMTVMFFAKEDVDCKLIATKESLLKSVTVPFEKGLGQKFRQPSGTGIDFSVFEDIGLTKEGDVEVYPLVVKAESFPLNDGERESDGNSAGNSQITQAVFEKKENGECKVRVMKQILWVNGMRYELQEIFGIGNSVENDQNGNDSGKECIICLSEPRDTTVLPCRHMCMCSGCAKVLRFQTNRCPVCRQPVDRLLEIKVVEGLVGNETIAGALEVNSVNDRDLTALDLVFPNETGDWEMEAILRGAGALRAGDIVHSGVQWFSSHSHNHTHTASETHQLQQQQQKTNTWEYFQFKKGRES